MKAFIAEVGTTLKQLLQLQFTLLFTQSYALEKPVSYKVDIPDEPNTYQEVFEELPEIMLHDKITGADVYRLPPHSLIAQDNEGAVVVGEEYVFFYLKGLTKEEFAQSFHDTEFTVLRLCGTIEA